MLLALLAFVPLSASAKGGKYVYNHTVERKKSVTEGEMEEIFVAIITGGLALVGVIITNVAGNRRAEEKLRVAQAITDAKIEELTREVRKHNNFAEKIPVIQEQIKVVNHRLADLEDIERKDHP